MLSISNISVQFGSKRLFDDVSFIVNPSDRIGLVGSNGSGKSTLMKILCGLIEPDTGIAAPSKHTTIDYLPQEGISYRGRTLYEEVYSAIADVSAVKNELDEVNAELTLFDDKNSPEYSDLVEKQGELQQMFEDMEGFRVKSNIEKILMGLGFQTPDLNRLTDEFSGGWQMRVALAKLLLKNPSVLLLDEPTNHLDLDSLLWLEGFLRSYRGAVMIVSHDRTFLDNMTGMTIEIYAGKVTIFAGNYSFYEKEKETRKVLFEKRYLNQQRYLKQQNRFIERFRYKANKASVVQSRIKMLEKIEIIELEDEEKAIHFKFPPATHSGKNIIDLRNIIKSYADNLVLQNLNLEIQRGDKIGFVGVNGAGKSTLARIIIGTEDYQSGERKLGYQVELEYYSQNQAESLDPNHTVLETLEKVAAGDIRKQLRTILGSFLFKGDDVFKQVSVLSGGEKSRLALAQMLLKSSNFLVLDEPTNHLDMNSKRVLMKALQQYEGTILIISHDREFLDGIVNKIIEVKDKDVKVYAGNCTYYLMRKQEELEGLNESDASTSSTKETASKKNKLQKRQEAELRNKAYNLSKPYKTKLAEIEEDIKSKEVRLKGIEHEMASKTFYRDENHVIEVNKEFKELKEQLQDLYDKWIETNNKLNEIESVFSGAESSSPGTFTK